LSRTRPRTRTALSALLLLSALLALPRPAAAVVLHEDPFEERSTELGLLVRSSAFLMHGPTLAPPYNLPSLTPPFTRQDNDPLGIGNMDLRLSFEHRNPWLKVVLHNELGGRVASGIAEGAFGLGRGPEPPRWLPLEWDLVQEDTFGIRDVVDWAYVALTLGPVTVTVGRQPVTITRGKFWQPLDLVAKFSLTEVDVEYKPGADVLRVDLSLGSRARLMVLAAAGTDPGTDDGSLALRGSSFMLRGSFGLGDFELGALAAFVRYDAVLGLDGVYDAGAFDVYGEAAVHVLTEKSLSPGLEQRGRAVPRVLLGANFKPLSKLTVSPELHYDGFGAWDRAEYFNLTGDFAVATSERVAIGEMYTMGRLYMGLMALWEAHALLNLNAALIVNLRDPGALLSLGAVYNVAANVELKAGCYLPLARVPELQYVELLQDWLPGKARSEFGFYPYFWFLQLKVHI
jgi:hypothetical protein